jgi:FkbM family methyltransferase
MPLERSSDGRRISFAQNGEDIVFLRALGDQPDGRWIDVGANHPIHDSVTKNFSDLGWRGINIEPVQHLHELLVEHRPRDINVRAVASDKPGTMVLHHNPQNPGLSTVDETLSAIYRERGDVLEEIEVEVVTLTSICEKFLDRDVIDIMKIDTEGHELPVLRGHDFDRFPVRTLCAEVTWDRLDAIVEFLDSRGMRFVNFDGLNAWFVRDADHAALGQALSTPASAVLDWFHPYIYLQQLLTLGAEVARLNEENLALRGSPESKTLHSLRRRLRRWFRR